MNGVQEAWAVVTDEEALVIIREAMAAGVIYKERFGGKVHSNPADIIERYKAKERIIAYYSGLENVVMSRMWPNIRMTSREDIEAGVKKIARETP